MQSESRKALAEFLERDQAVAKAKGEASSERAWCKLYNLEPSEIRRARHQKLDLGVDKLDKYADALGVDPWQLLFPGFVRGSPQFPTMSAEAISVALELDKIEDPERRKKLAASVLTLMEQPAASPASPPAQTAEPPQPSADSMRGRAPHR